MIGSKSPHHASASPKSPTLSQPPSLPPLSISNPLDCTLPSHLNGPLDLLAIPSEIRRLIYNAIIPFGPLIVLQLHAHTTLLKHLYALSRTCHFLHKEVDIYLTTHPLTILCTGDLRPNILSGISPAALARVETLVIEDYPAKEPIWALLRNLKTICFTEIHESTIHHTTAASAAPTVSPNPTTPDPQQQPPINLTWPPSTILPSNNTVLAHAHRFWQDLRLQNRWIWNLWKREPPFHELPRLRVLLRRVYEAHVVATDADDEHKDKIVVVAWHDVVDVDSRKVVENRHLPVREAAADNDGGGDAVFPYAAQTWWRRELGVKDN